MTGSRDIQNSPHNGGVTETLGAGERGGHGHALTIARTYRKASRPPGT